MAYVEDVRHGGAEGGGRCAGKRGKRQNVPERESLSFLSEALFLLPRTIDVARRQAKMESGWEPAETYVLRCVFDFLGSEEQVVVV